MLSDVGGTEVMGVAIPESDDLYTGFPIETVSSVSDGGDDSDLLNLGAFNSEDVQAQRLDFDDDGTQNSLLLSFGGDPYGLVVLVNHFGLDAPGTDPDGRIE